MDSSSHDRIAHDDDCGDYADAQLKVGMHTPTKSPKRAFDGLTEASHQQKPEIVLIRGLPGSGKSTLAKAMEGYGHFEADMYFEVDGKYVYDPAKVSMAHDWCVASAKAALKRGESVVVSNTFAKRWELQRYVDLGHPFRIVEAKGRWSNIHGVPEEKIAMMRARWEPLAKILKSFVSADGPTA